MRALALAAVLLLGASCAGPNLTKGGGLRAVSVKQEALDAAFAPRRYALLIGISDFDDEQWRDLRFAAKDAEDVAVALRDPARGHFDEVVSLTTPEETSRARILAALDALAAKATRPEDIVVVYVSSHGTLARDRRGELRRYLVTRDASFRDVAETALSIDALDQKLERLGSRRRLLVLATCHSGSGKSLLPEQVAKELQGIKSGFYARPLEDVSRAAMVLAASDWGETAREDETLQNDIYTHFLLEGLDGIADRNGDGAVSAYEAHDYARRKTFAFTEGRQRPSAEILEVGADPIILAGSVRRTGNPELYSYNQRLDGFTLKVDGEERTELPGGTAVKPGSRKIELTKGDQLFFSDELSLGAGQRIDLDLLLRRVAPRRTVFLTGGVFGFVDQKSRSEVLPATPLMGLSLRFDDLPLNDFSLWVDVGGSFGKQRLNFGPGAEVPFDYRNITAGVAMPWRFATGPVRLFVGPRVAGVYLQRSFHLDLVQGAQSYLTMSPGVMGGLSVLLGDRLELSAQGNLMWMYMMVDGAGQSVGFTGGWAGVGYRF